MPVSGRDVVDKLGSAAWVDANTPKRLEFYGLPVLPSPVRDAPEAGRLGPVREHSVPLFGEVQAHKFDWDSNSGQSLRWSASLRRQSYVRGDPRRGKTVSRRTRRRHKD